MIQFKSSPFPYESGSVIPVQTNCSNAFVFSYHCCLHRERFPGYWNRELAAKNGAN